MDKLVFGTIVTVQFLGDSRQFKAKICGSRQSYASPQPYTLYNVRLLDAPGTASIGQDEVIAVH